MLSLPPRRASRRDGRIDDCCLPASRCHHSSTSITPKLYHEDESIARRFGGMPLGGSFRVPIACDRPIRTTYVTAHVCVGTGGWSDTANANVKQDGGGTKDTVWWFPVAAYFFNVSKRGSFGGGHLPFAGRI